MNQQLKNYIQRECEKGEIAMSQNFNKDKKRPVAGTETMEKKLSHIDKYEWECPECDRNGDYADIRFPIDRGVDCCPDCGTPVVCVGNSGLLE
jgi:hypothetical protein